MPASLFGERFFGRRTPAWHGLGTVMDADLTVSQALEHVDIGFEIVKAPTFAHIDTTDETGAYRTLRVPTNSYAVIREPTYDDPQHRILSTVGEQWTPIQTSDLARMLDPISQKYPVETMGAIGHGEKIFITLDAGTAEIAGEEHHLYYLVTDHRDGSGALTIAFTPVRVVCQNTLICGLNDARVKASLVHTKQIVEDAEWYTGLFNQMFASQDKVVGQMNELSEVTINEEQEDAIITSAYPDASAPRQLTLARGITMDDVPKHVWSELSSKRMHLREEWERRQARVERIRETAKEQYTRFNDEFTSLARTPWAVWQAVVETEDYRRGHKDSASAIYGQRAESKGRAFKTALQIARSEATV